MKPLIFIITSLLLVALCKAETIIVDANGSGDFSDIQSAIDYSWDGDTVLVRPGTYGRINFNGRRITLTSLNPDDASIVVSTVITSDYYGATVTFDFGEDSDSVITGFNISNGGIGGKAISCFLAAPTIWKNIVGSNGTGIYNCEGVISNNIIMNGNIGIESYKGVISNNIIRQSAIGIKVTNAGQFNQIVVVKNNIIANTSNGLYSTVPAYKTRCDNSFNCFYSNGSDYYNDSGSYVTAGLGDFHRDPLLPDWTIFNLMSTAGRWTGTEWVLDDRNSPCIDKGDPNDPVGFEPNPNGGRINIGADGGTSYASKSPSGIVQPVCTQSLPMDFNNDCKVDFQDYARFAQSWLDCNLDPPSACWQ